jgi:hypothetical protein
MALIYFIGEQYLKDKTVLSNNIDIELITPNIEYSQDSHIQPLLGSKFYNSLQLSYSAQTLNNYEVELVNLIKPALAYRSAEASLPFINLQIRNKGINKLNSENAVQADLADMKYLRDTLQSRSEFYEKRIQDYLCLNGNHFPDYTNPDSPIAPNQSSVFDCDLYFKPSPCGDNSNCNCGNC